MPHVSVQQGFNVIWEFCQAGTAEYLSSLRTSPTQHNLLAFVIVMTIHKALSYFCHPMYFLPAEGGLSPFLPLTSPVEESRPAIGRISVSQLDCLQSSELSSVPLFEHEHSLIATEVEKGYGLKDVKFPQVSWKYLTSQKKNQLSNNTPVEGKLLCKFLSFLGNREKTKEKDLITFIAHGKAWSWLHPRQLSRCLPCPFLGSLLLVPLRTSPKAAVGFGQPRGQRVRSCRAVLGPGHLREEQQAWIAQADDGKSSAWDSSETCISSASNSPPVETPAAFGMSGCRDPAECYPLLRPALEVRPLRAIRERWISPFWQLLWGRMQGKVGRKLWWDQLVEYNTAHLPIFNPNCLCLHLKKFLLWIC